MMSQQLQNRNRLAALVLLLGEEPELSSLLRQPGGQMALPRPNWFEGLAYWASHFYLGKR
jgi:hypothetical protein